MTCCRTNYQRGPSGAAQVADSVYAEKGNALMTLTTPHEWRGHRRRGSSRGAEKTSMARRIRRTERRSGLKALMFHHWVKRRVSWPLTPMAQCDKCYVEPDTGSGCMLRHRMLVVHYIQYVNSSVKCLFRINDGKQQNMNYIHDCL